jgi:hypothetical protein
VVHDSGFIAGVPNTLESGEFYGGASTSGYLIFIAPIGDKGVILKYSELFGSEVFISVY